MIIKNARVFTEDGSFVHGDVVVKDGRFDSVLERTADTDAAADSTQQSAYSSVGYQGDICHVWREAHDFNK